MTSLIPHVLYKYEASASPKIHLIHSTSYCSQAEASYRLRTLHQFKYQH
jgi:hypothetical protein